MITFPLKWPNNPDDTLLTLTSSVACTPDSVITGSICSKSFGVVTINGMLASDLTARFSFFM